jgi:beta-galactosidase
MNRYGEGRAIYVATVPHRPVMQALYRSLYGQLGIACGPVTPEGVYAREVQGRTLSVNTTARPQEIQLDGRAPAYWAGRHGAARCSSNPLGQSCCRSSG